MIIRKNNIGLGNRFIFFLIFYFTYLGYYASLLLISNFVSLESSRLFTIPIRLLVVGCLVILFFIQFKYLRFPKIVYLFSIFVLAYLLRLFISYNLDTPYYLPISEVFFYFVSFCILPFIVLIGIRYNEIQFKILFKSLLYGGCLFAVLVLIYYGKYVGNVSRLGVGVVDESVINPLALSYSSILIISVFIFYLIHNKVKLAQKTIAIVSIVLSVIPFFLGASRGSLLAIAITILIYLLSSKNYKAIIKSLVMFIMGVFLLVTLDNYLNSGLLDRVLNTSEDVNQNNTSAERIVIWKNAFNQFLNHPFIGDKLAVDNWESYAHNILIETLQTTGVFGFIPLVILFWFTWRKVFYIAKTHKEYFWIVVIFIQSFVQNMFSGSIYISTWLWVSVALVWGLNKYLISQKKII